jgi:hypothetical protein
MNDSKIKLVFIGGASRSGSTLLDRMLGQTEGFFSLGEMFHLWERSLAENQLCGCGQPFRLCDFWKKVIEETFGKLGHSDVKNLIKLQRSVSRLRYIPQLAFPKFRLKNYQDRLTEYVSILERLYKSIAKVSGCNVLIDSSKIPDHGFILREIPGVELYVIHLVRDSRAVAYSWQRKKVRPEIYWTEAYMHQRGLLEAVKEWILFNLFTQLLKKKADYYKLVLYERLTALPKDTVEGIINWIGTTYNDLKFFIEEKTLKMGVDHTVSGNPFRFKQGEIAICSDEEWKQKMSFLKKLAVGIITWILLSYYKTHK